VRGWFLRGEVASLEEFASKLLAMVLGMLKSPSDAEISKLVAETQLPHTVMDAVSTPRSWLEKISSATTLIDELGSLDHVDGTLPAPSGVP